MQHRKVGEGHLHLNDSDGGVFTIALDGAGADTLLLDTTIAADLDIATADTWILLIGVDSDTLVPASFI